MSIQESLYIVDQHNRPLAVMDGEQIHRQGLMHRGVYLLLRIRQKRLVLRQRSKDNPVYPGRWDIAGCGHVGVGEASQDAAERFIPQALFNHDVRLVHLRSLTASPYTGNEFVEIFQSRLNPQLAQLLEEDLQFMSVDQDELQALVTGYPDMLTPALMTVWNTSIAFPPS